MKADDTENILAALGPLTGSNTPDGKFDPTSITEEDRALIDEWVGWGTSGDLLTAEYRDTIRRYLGAAEVESAQRAMTTAFYTPRWLVSAIWDGIRGLGWQSGRVLEAGCGSGLFLDGAGDESSLVGIEADILTSRAAQVRNPSATIINSRYEHWRPSRDVAFDLAVGNVPFGADKPYDPIYNSLKLSIHNYFLYRNLVHLAPGGLMAVITSHYTLNGANPRARDAIASVGELIGAVRLPNKTFSGEGTDVCADLLVFRRLTDTEPAPTQAADIWRYVTKMEIETTNYWSLRQIKGKPPVLTNNCFSNGDPRFLVAGTQNITSGMYGAFGYGVQREEDVNLQESVCNHVEAMFSAIGYRFPKPQHIEQAVSLTGTPTRRQVELLPGTIRRSEVPGEFERFVALSQSWEPHPTPNQKEATELGILIEMRDAARAVVAGTLGRENLDELHSTYVNQFGEIRRSTGTVENPRFPRMGGFRNDPGWPIVASIERRPIVATVRTAAKPETVADALATTLNESITVRPAAIAALLPDATEESVTAELCSLGLAFKDPASNGDLVTADEYLSGNVRLKLEQASFAGDEYAANVAALRDVVPEDLTPETIEAQLGAPWLGAKVVKEFLEQELGILDVQVETDSTVGFWKINCDRSVTPRARQWGTPRMIAVDIVAKMLNFSPIRVWDEVDGRKILNPVATEAANETASRIRARFSEWLWEDPDRTEMLVKEFNERFRSHAPRTFDGAHLQFPGMSPDFTPRWNQANAVWRIVAGGNALIAHAVGAGKTAVLCASAMETRRLGLSKLPMIVVPNHLLEQFVADFQSSYPAAKILSAGRNETSKAEREELVAAAALGDWDCVVITHSAFGRIPLSDAVQESYLRRQLAEFDVLAGVNAARKSVLKRIERLKRTAEARLEKHLDSARDGGVGFEQLGVDFLLIDEAHRFKNLAINTASDVATSAPSKAATDLDAKIDFIRHNHNPKRSVVFSTGTPISNTLAEMWTTTHYVAPYVLEEAGVGSFDSWLATFATLVSQLEMDPSGIGWRMKTRISKFANVPEMSLMFARFAEVLLEEDLGLDLPVVQRTTVAVDPSPQLEDAMADIARRADLIRARAVTPEEDNFLNLATDARHASLDTRLVGELRPANGGKVDALIANLRKVPTRSGHLQVVFCELGTPNSVRWSVYHEIRNQLVANGFDADRVRFAQDPKNDAQKDALFRACVAGDVDVLIGSTATFGEGTNIQDLISAIHHLDAPWRPSDIRQREGRGIRPGNQHGWIDIYTYVVTESYDAFMWGVLERKARFIDQIMRPAQRVIEDIGEESALTYAQIKAIASGNPLVLERAALEAEIAQQRRLRTAHVRQSRSLRDEASRLKEVSDSNTRRRRFLERVRVDSPFTRHEIHIGHNKAPCTSMELVDKFDALANGTRLGLNIRDQTFTFQLKSPRVVLVELTDYMARAPMWSTKVALKTLTGTESIVEIWEQFVAELPGVFAGIEQKIAKAKADIAELEEALSKPFDNTVLDAAELRMQAIDFELTGSKDEPELVEAAA